MRLYNQTRTKLKYKNGKGFYSIRGGDYNGKPNPTSHSNRIFIPRLGDAGLVMTSILHLIFPHKLNIKHNLACDAGRGVKTLILDQWN